MLDRVSRLVTITFLLMAVFVVVRPGTPLRKRFDAWLLERRQKAIVRSEWAAMSETPAIIGGSGAQATLVEFIDYQCAYCRTFHDSIPSLSNRYPEVRIAIRHLPRPGDLVSRAAALAVICATNTGEFEALHRFLLTDTAWRHAPVWHEVAARAGLQHSDGIETCMTAPVTVAALARDSTWAEQLVLRETPVFAGRSGLHRGVAPVDSVGKWVAGTR